ATLVSNVASGRNDENFLVGWFQNKAKAMYKNLREDIDAGLTVREIADPYISTMAQTLELAPTSINVFDKTIRRALTKQGGVEDLSDFEERLRRDSRWDSTDN